MKIFYSWQSDTPASTNRNFIRKAAEDAIAQLETHEEFEDAVRTLELDQDTKGVLGSPAIAETILRKIREADVVLVDVTLADEAGAGRKHLNSNVAIELGYALGVQGDQVLLKVMNTHFGEPGELPFDLRHRRWPVRYCLSPDATKAEKAEQKSRLVGELAGIFAEYLRQTSRNSETFARRDAGDTSGHFFRHGECMISGDDEDDDRPIRFLTWPAAFYLRLWPEMPVRISLPKMLFAGELESLEPLGPQLLETRRLVRNQWGYVACGWKKGHKGIGGISQIFKNGEIWGCNTVPFTNHERPTSSDESGDIHIEQIEDALRMGLGHYLDLAWNKLNYRGRVCIEAGLVNVKGYSLQSERGWAGKRQSGEIYEKEVSFQTAISDRSALQRDRALSEVFNHIFEEAGEERPFGFNDFVPEGIAFTG